MLLLSGKPCLIAFMLLSFNALQADGKIRSGVFRNAKTLESSGASVMMPLQELEREVDM